MKTNNFNTINTTNFDTHYTPNALAYTIADYLVWDNHTLPPSVADDTQDALITLKNAWEKCAKIFDNAEFPKELVDSTNYPFKEPLSECTPMVEKWVEKTCTNLEKLTQIGLTDDIYWLVIADADGNEFGHLLTISQYDQTFERIDESLIDELESGKYVRRSMPSTERSLYREAVVRKVKDIEDLRQLMIWENYNFENSAASHEFGPGIEYPPYVPNMLRLSRCVEHASPLTSLEGPDGKPNPTAAHYASILKLEKKLRKEFSPEELLAMSLSCAVQDNDLTPKKLLDLCKFYKVSQTCMEACRTMVADYNFNMEKDEAKRTKIKEAISGFMERAQQVNDERIALSEKFGEPVEQLLANIQDGEIGNIDYAMHIVDNLGILDKEEEEENNLEM